MKATELLEGQHREVEDLFQSLAAAGDETRKNQLFGELAHRLVAHDAIERQLFYPACERALGVTDLLGESLVEHGVVEFLLYQAARSFGEADFQFKLNVLEEAVTYHAGDEEEELFPAVETALGHARLQELGEKMKQRFDAVRASDYRVSLMDTLQRVLAGADTPTKNGVGAKKHPPKPRAKSAH
jgi:hemerythrin superfamily protein